MLKIFYFIFPKVCENRFRTFVHGTVDVCHLLFRMYFQEELAAKEAKLSDQSQLDVDHQRHAWCLQQNDQFNAKSAALR